MHVCLPLCSVQDFQALESQTFSYYLRYDHMWNKDKVILLSFMVNNFAVGNIQNEIYLLHVAV